MPLAEPHVSAALLPGRGRPSARTRWAPGDVLCMAKRTPCSRPHGGMVALIHDDVLTDRRLLPYDQPARRYDTLDTMSIFC